MPSRVGIGFILLFWLITMAYVGYRDVVPWFLATAQPPRVDPADEATPPVSVRWSIYRGEERVGSLSTRTEFVPADGSYRYVKTYRDLRLDFGKLIGVRIPQLVTTMRVTRSGELLEQTLSGEMQAVFGGVNMGTATAEVTGVVRDGQLHGHCKIKSPISTIDQPLEPVPVPAESVLNPLMPVGRLHDVEPGRWTVREIDPLSDAINVLLREVAKKSAQESKLLEAMLGRRESRELLAEVKETPERLTRPDGTDALCWVIEYRREDAQARTWVRKSDGRVLRQEASGFGEKLRYEREE